MSSSPTCSAQRAAANRANAQKSTGPRTPAGKHTSAQNASTHHAYSADLLQPGEPEPFFHAHREAILDRLCPMDAVELCLAERVVSAAWRLRRLQSATTTSPVVFMSKTRRKGGAFMSFWGRFYVDSGALFVRFGGAFSIAENRNHSIRNLLTPSSSRRNYLFPNPSHPHRLDRLELTTTPIRGKLPTDPE